MAKILGPTVLTLASLLLVSCGDISQDGWDLTDLSAPEITLWDGQLEDSAPLPPADAKADLFLPDTPNFQVDMDGPPSDQGGEASDLPLLDGPAPEDGLADGDDGRDILLSDVAPEAGLDLPTEEDMGADEGLREDCDLPPWEDQPLITDIEVTEDNGADSGGTELCQNGQDDDGDGLTDCLDPDCFLHCSPEVCDNGTDDDGDGLTDCLDPHCALHPDCHPELCSNGEDDDGDGLVDCQDLECLWAQACLSELCHNGQDDDGNNLIDCEDPTCGALCGHEMLVPQGAFAMGRDDGAALDEAPLHEVWLDPFTLDVTEVTAQAYAVFLNELGSHLDGCDGFDCIAVKSEDQDSPLALVEDTYLVEEGLEDHPITHVSWYGAVAYCQWAGKGLPTEAQWEKGARGLDGRLYPWGEASPSSGDLANCLEGSCHDGAEGTSPVGSFPAGASPYGALDMAGNVAEWVADRYNPEYYNAAPPDNPPGPEEGDGRVRRGGSHRYADWTLTTTDRDSADPLSLSSHTGFRCLRSQGE